MKQKTWKITLMAKFLDSYSAADIKESLDLDELEQSWGGHVKFIRSKTKIEEISE